MSDILNLIMMKQEYLFYLMTVMVVAGIIKEHNYFVDFLNIIQKYIPSKRAMIALTSAVTGVLPIPGRVTVSAGILETMAPTKEHQHSRSKFGIVDYLSTHLYYLFSPLEKTIIVPMAALSLAYTDMLYYTLPILTVSLAYVVFYIFYRLEESDIQITIKDTAVDFWRFLFGAMPLFGAIGAMVYGVEPYIAFPVVAFYYMLISDTFSIRKLSSYVNWSLVAVLAIVIAASNFAGTYKTEIMDFLGTGWTMDTVQGFLAVSSVAFLASFFMGSSGKYAGIVALLATVFGVKYLTWFLALEFAAYLISPTHKCSHIGRMYFGTPLKEYYSTLGTWVLVILGAGGSSFLLQM